MRQALISLGSNHQPRHHLYQGLLQLDAIGRDLYMSGLYRNPACLCITPGEAARDFVNGALVLGTHLSLEELAHTLKQLERRIAGERSGQICGLDLDLMAYEGFVGRCGRHQLPRQPDKEQSYFWRCLEDLSKKSILSGDRGPWKQENWVSFSSWQSPAESVQLNARSFLETLL